MSAALRLQVQRSGRSGIYRPATTTRALVSFDSFLTSFPPVMSTSKSSEGSSSGVTDTFCKAWVVSTADSNLTLHGFRRFKTTHLLDLRFLECEVAEMDRILYQDGLGLGISHSPADNMY